MWTSEEIYYLLELESCWLTSWRKKTKQMVSLEHDFDYLENSALVAFFGVIALSEVQSITKNGVSLIKNASHSEKLFIGSLINFFQSVYLAKFWSKFPGKPSLIAYFDIFGESRFDFKTKKL